MVTTRRSARILTQASTTAAAATAPVAPKPASPSKVTKARTKKPKVTPIPKTTAATLLTAPPLTDEAAMDVAIEHLKNADKRLGEFIAKSKRCTMGLDRDHTGDTGYISLCKSIVYQQLAGKAAAAILLKFLRRFGTLKDLTKEDSELTPDDFEFPKPSVVASLDVDEMRECGLGQRKSEYMKAVAEKFRDGELSDAKLAALSDDEVTKALVAIRGIGPWTADMFLMFHLKRANVLPTLDLAIRKSMCKHFGVPFTKTTPTHDELVALGRIWEPYRSVATWYMWRMSDTKTQE